MDAFDRTPDVAASSFSRVKRHVIHVVSRVSETAICIEGELAEETIDSFAALFQLGLRPDDWLFAVDLTECTYIDSAAISGLVLLARRFPDRFEVRIRPHGLVHHVFEVCGFLDREFFIKVIPLEAMG